MKKRTVVKFGGSNLKTKADIQKIIEVIKGYPTPPIVVVSAFYGITNFLVDIIENVEMNASKEADNIVQTYTVFLSRMKNEIINQNIDNTELRTEVTRKMSERLQELERYLKGAHYIGEVPHFVKDIVLSYGERFSSLILNEVLKYNGINSREILPEELGLITDGEFGNASIDFELATPLVQSSLSEEMVYVVPGFYGISSDHKVTLLGRGGSDYSAAAIANCIDAQSLDVWKDVNGFMSADPKLVANPIRLHTLTYTEAAELAYFGARILHPRTVEPLMEKHIPIRIFNIDKTENKFEPLSIINSTKVIHTDIVKSVTYSDDFCILKLRGPGIGVKQGELAKVTHALDEAGINIKSVITSQIVINLLLSANDLQPAHLLLQKLRLKTVTEMLAIDNISVIAVVGEGLIEQHGIAARIFSAVARKQINVKIIVLGASQVVSYFIIDRKDRDVAIREIHAEFFENKS